MANSNISKNIKTGMLSSYDLNVIPTNAPSNTAPRHSKYNAETALYYNRYSKYADNIFDAEIQGLDYDDFYKWKKVRLRSSAVIDPSTGENLSISWQKIMILDKHVDFIPIGAYVKFNNATWIVYNPDNIASSTGTAIVVRCNTTYNTLDYYGNVVKTPMFYNKGTILASSPYYMQYSATIDGYQHIVMQLNDITSGITNNTRIILGKSAFGMYGVSDFPEEFTGDTETCHILRADLRLQETLPTDDIVEHVADRGHFSFDIAVGGRNTMHEGDTDALEVVSYRNGEKIVSTVENPLNFSWNSSDASVATVDDEGNVIAIANGSATITCTLLENPSISDTFEVTVIERESANYVDFITPIPKNIRTFDTVAIEASYFEDGIQTGNTVNFSVVGKPNNAYSVTINGNTLTIQTFLPTTEPIAITAECNGYNETATINVEGY